MAPVKETSLKTIVVKLGGEIVRSKELSVVAQDLRVLVDGFHRVAIVHGGGPQVTEMQARLGIETRMIAGRRYTDAATLEVLLAVVAGQLNVSLCAQLLANGVMGVGLHGPSGHVIQAKRRPPKLMQGAGPDPVDLGLVGDVTGFNLPLLFDLFERRYVPVLACVGCDAKGQLLNINGDTVASELSAALEADALVLVTSTPGVLADVRDPKTRIPRIDRKEFEKMVREGTISGGMIPKLEESFAVIAQGVKSVVVVGKVSEGDLVRAVLHPGEAGTVLVA